MAQPTNPNPIRPFGEGRSPDSPREALPAPPALRPGIEQLRELVEDGLDLLIRRLRVFAVVAGSVGVILLLAILLQTPVYEATSLLLVKFGRELVYQTEVGTEQTLTARDKETVINSELAILHSRPVLREVGRAVGLATLYPDLGEAVAELEATPPSESRDREIALLYAQAAERVGESVSAQALPDADVLSISFQHEDPIVAEATVTALVSRFLEAHLKAYGEPEMATFLDERVASYQARLDASEKELLEFETEHAAFALESPQTTLMKWRDETLQDLSEVENQMSTVRMRHMEDAAVAEARNTLMNLQLDAEKLVGDLKKETEARIGVVKRVIAQRRAEVEREVYILEKKKETLAQKLGQIEQELVQFPTLSAEYRRLRRERDADEEQYATYLRRLRDARLSSDMDREKIASISIIQPASTAPAPVWPPRKALSIPMALVLALVAGGLVAVLADRLGGTSVPWLDAPWKPWERWA